MKKEENYNCKVQGVNSRCVGDRIIIRPLGVLVPKLYETVDDIEKRSTEDLYSMTIDHPFKGEVVFVGDGYTSGIEFTGAPKVSIGDVVLYDRKSTNILKLDVGNGYENFTVIREANVHFVLESIPLDIKQKETEK